jgi:hypothetical protein
MQDSVQKVLPHYFTEGFSKQSSGTVPPLSPHLSYWSSLSQLYTKVTTLLTSTPWSVLEAEHIIYYLPKKTGEALFNLIFPTGSYTEFMGVYMDDRNKVAFRRRMAAQYRALGNRDPSLPSSWHESTLDLIEGDPNLDYYLKRLSEILAVNFKYFNKVIKSGISDLANIKASREVMRNTITFGLLEYEGPHPQAPPPLTPFELYPVLNPISERVLSIFNTSGTILNIFFTPEELARVEEAYALANGSFCYPNAPLLDGEVGTPALT